MMVRNLFFAIAVAAITGIVVDHSMAQGSGTENLYAQYYTQPGASLAHAEMYPAPHPVPRHVGHTYYTHQPLMPHEMMYAHSRNYHNYYAGPDSFYCNMCGGCSYRPGYGVTKTNVRWLSTHSHIAPLPGTWAPFQKLGYCLSRVHTVKPPGGCRGGHCKKGCAGSGCTGGCAADGCADGSCYPQDGGGCENCDSYTQSDWQRLRSQAAARAAQSMAGRYNR